MVSVINVKKLTMIYKTPLRDAGFQAALKSLFRRTYRKLEAVQNISFELAVGEVTGSLVCAATQAPQVKLFRK